MSVNEQRRSSIFWWIFLVILLPSALFYLFVVPMLAAATPRDSGVIGVLFGSFMLIQLFILVWTQAFDAASILYGHPPHFLHRMVTRLINRRRHKQAAATKTSGSFVIIPMMISYCTFNYAFAVVYVFVSSIDASSFSTGRALGVFEAIYFSVITSATVGYGDIAPKSDIARMLVVIQVGISLLYVIMLFSGFASHLREHPVPQESDRREDSDNRETPPQPSGQDL